MARPISVFLSSLLLLLAANPAAHAALEEPTYKALRESRPDGRRIEVRDLELQRDVFELRFESGTFHLVQPVAGETLSAVFLGQGRFRLNPATENERRHLAMILDEKDFEVLSDTFTEMVLHFTDGTFAELEAAGEIHQGDVDPRALKVHKQFLERQKKDFHANFQLRVLRDLLSEPRRSEGVFIALVDGKRHPLALAAVDPLGAEELGLNTRLAGEDSIFYVADSQRGGYWYLSDQKKEIDSGRAEPWKPLADAVHYEIDTEIVKDVDLRGTTTIRLLPKVWDHRVLPLLLLPALRLTKADFALEFSTGPTPWIELPFIQEKRREDADAAVVFPEPLPMGATLLLRLSYEGEDILRNAGERNYVVGARSSWYPNLGTFLDPATYDLTYRIAEGLELVSVGQKASESVANGVAVSRWATQHPVRVAGFNYGRFQSIEEREEVSGLTLRVYTNPGTPDLIRNINNALRASSQNSQLGGFVGNIDTSRLAKSALVDAMNMARVGSIYFGALPQEHVAMTQQSQMGFGQSWPSLIFLPYTAFMSSTQRIQLASLGGSYTSSARFERLGYHELAHQWWGHLLGWASYRDQWLSEGFAEFSAILTAQFTDGWDAYDQLWDGARDIVLEKSTGSLIANHKVGPISQGWRLSNRRAPRAYNAIVYRKGAYVLHMLRMMMWQPTTQDPDARFIALMRDFVATHADESPTTADFQAAVERHMTPEMKAAGNGTMDWFFDQWVHGTDIPSYSSKLDIRKDGDEYHITGSVEQSEVSNEFRAFMPIYVDFGKKGMARAGFVGLLGNVRRDVDFRIALPQKPKRVLINAHRDILARKR